MNVYPWEDAIAAHICAVDMLYVNMLCVNLLTWLVCAVDLPYIDALCIDVYFV